MVDGWDSSISDAVDYFGKENLRIEVIKEKKLALPKPGGYLQEPTEYEHWHYLVTAKTNDRAMMEFAKTYARLVDVLEPAYLREEMFKIFKMAYERMAGIDDDKKH